MYRRPNREEILCFFDRLLPLKLLFESSSSGMNPNCGSGCLQGIPYSHLFERGHPPRSHTAGGVLLLPIEHFP